MIHFLPSTLLKIKFKLSTLAFSSPTHTILTLLESERDILLEMYNFCFRTIPSGRCYFSVHFICSTCIYNVE